MPLQLQTYIAAHGNELKIGRKSFTVLGLTSEGDGPDAGAIATVKAVRATYTAVRCNKTRVVGRPGAEAWAIISSSGLDIARFAVHEGQLVPLG
ncbi:hypothetical protein [Burkholderia ubonensis]|uniref:hypothetical protein n=1 Tax=Burkholderia ubonensis TaxID=101571 RepID=UPI000A5A24C8|nr:hypothetical protein [Burkholderia ubonensis]